MYTWELSPSHSSPSSIRGQKMALAPSKIMSWQFTRELVAKRMNKDSYSKWKQNEEAAKRRAEEMKRGKM